MSTTSKGEHAEGSPRSHQVLLSAARKHLEQLAPLADWLSSYVPHELLDVESVLEGVDRRQPQEEECVAYESLAMPEWEDNGTEKGAQEGCIKVKGEPSYNLIKE